MTDLLSLWFDLLENEWKRGIEIVRFMIYVKQTIQPHHTYIEKPPSKKDI